MAIVISGVNNNDKITATDGLIDLLSGVSYASTITAPAINATGNITAASINVGNNIQLGNAGVATATTFVGNLTGNVNNTGNLLLQIGGSEKFRVGGSGQLGIGGANYGTSGQVLTSGGSGSAATWSTVTGTTINNNADDRVITGSGSANSLNAQSNLTFDGDNFTITASNHVTQILKAGGATSDLYIDFKDSSNNLEARILCASDQGDLRFYTGGANERLRIKPGGDLTISNNLSITGVSTSNNNAFSAISKTASSDTYTDLFVYDTRKDSDGGAWRHRTNNTSWYNETLNTSIRGSRRDFPQVAIVAVGNNFIHIFDADDPDMPMWMKFPTPSGSNRNAMYGTGNPRCVHMLNGILATGSQSTSHWPILIDFIRDDILGVYNSTGHLHYSGRQGNISLRDAATSSSGLWWPATVNGGSGTSGSDSGQNVRRWWFGGLIVNTHVTSVVMSVRPEAPIDKTTGMQIPTIYYGTRGGMSIIHSNVGDTGTSYHTGVYDVTSNNGPYSAIGDITITEEGFIWGLCDSFNSYATYRDSIAIDLKRLDNQMNDIVTRPDLDTIVSGLNDQNGGGVSKGREFYWVSTGAEQGTHKLGYSNTWAATIVERNAWGCAEGFGLHTKPTYDYDHKEFGNFSGHADANRALVALITKDYNSGWHMTGTEISSCYIGHGLTSSISGSAAMLDLGHQARQLDVTGTLTRAKCATGSDLSCVSGFSSSNYARISSANLNAGNPPDITMMGWIKITDIGGYSYLCSVATGSDGMGIAIHADSASNGGKPYFYDNQQGSLVHEKGVNDGEWHHICGVRECSSNRKIIYVDGVRSGNVQYPSNADYSDLDTLAVGHWCETSGTAQNYHCRGSLALVKIGLTGLTDEQVKKIYEDEKKLFQPNAKAFLYGSSSAVTAIGYDEKKDIYHVGTSSGRSDFSGLSRINNTTTAVTTAISAYDGLIAEQ